MDSITLRPYQKEAVKAWSETSKGVLHMATGTGKTFTALKIISNTDKRYIVIACPTQVLMDQWEKDIQDGFEDEESQIQNILKMPRDESTLKSILLRDTNSKIVVLTTHTSFLRTLILFDHQELLVVGDEVHGLGAKSIRDEVLPSNYPTTLGLSATPERLEDSEGNQFIRKLFGNVVYRYTLGQAIEDDYLSRYTYIYTTVSLTSDESNEYDNYTRRISIEMSKKKPDTDKIQTMRVNRARIIKKAKGKIEVLEKIYRDICRRKSDLRCLVFCAENTQLNNASRRFLQLGEVKMDKIGSQTLEVDREEIIRDFSKGHIRFLLSMNVLSEGISVNSANSAILLSNTSNPREYIQRRGRILRTHEGKSMNLLYDVLVSKDDEVLESEKKRLKVFSQDAHKTVEL